VRDLLHSLIIAAFDHEQFRSKKLMIASC